MKKGKKHRSWRGPLLWLAGAFGLFLAVLAVAAYTLARRVEPYLQEQTAAYLRRRFDSDLTWARFRVRMSLRSPLRVLLERGKGAMAGVRINGIELRHKGRTDIPPLVSMRELDFEVELASLLERPARVRHVRMEGLEINIPPRGGRPGVTQLAPPAAPNPPQEAGQAPAQDGAPSVLIDEILANGAHLLIFPMDPAKPPLDFDIYRLQLDSAGPGVPLRYTATLNNAKPPGLIESSGTFGPWAAEDPAETPLGGDYTFRDADLSVFKGIAGILSSTGKFQGRLNRIAVEGETFTPDFRLASSGNPMPLATKFQALVDGTNGNTELKPVEATIHGTRFVAAGSVARHPGDPGKTISLDVTMREGRVEDMLRLAVRGDRPLLEGGMDLTMKFLLPPGKGELADRLRLTGDFKLLAAQFTTLTVQEKIDSLSRRGQGKPSNTKIANVPSDFVGKFVLEQGVISLRDLSFAIPGALVLLDGKYHFKDEALDFRGKLRLQARLSRTMTGWKRLALLPIDPIFAKEGAGTVLRIKITGTRSNLAFGLDR